MMDAVSVIMLATAALAVGSVATLLAKDHSRHVPSTVAQQQKEWRRQ
jgi:NADPH-dependent curcumin reductase CurA